MLQAQKDGKTRKKSKGHIKLPRIQWIISRVSRRLWSWLRGRLPWRFRFGCGWRPVSQRGSVCSYFISCFKNQVLLGPSYNISGKKKLLLPSPSFRCWCCPTFNTDLPDLLRPTWMQRPAFGFAEPAPFGFVLHGLA